MIARALWKLPGRIIYPLALQQYTGCHWPHILSQRLGTQKSLKVPSFRNLKHQTGAKERHDRHVVRRFNTATTSHGAAIISSAHAELIIPTDPFCGELLST